MVKKKELSTILNDAADVVSAIKAAADTISDASKKTLKVISAARTLYDIPDDPADTAGEKPEKAGTPKKKETPAPEPEKKAGPEPAQETPTEKAYTKADVRKFLAGVAGGHRREVKELLKKYGADTLTQLDEKHYAAIMADAEELADA